MAVLNKHRHGIPPKAVYIGRGSPWGNPFIIGRDGDRDAVVEQYEAMLASQIDSGSISLEALAALHGKDLVCFCAPQRCHGDVLERAAEWAHNQLILEDKS